MIVKAKDEKNQLEKGKKLYKQMIMVLIDNSINTLLLTIYAKMSLEKTDDIHCIN